MSGEEWLWKIVYYDEESMTHTEWILAPSIDIALAWANHQILEDDRIDSIKCIGMIQAVSDNYLAPIIPSDVPRGT